MTKATKPLTPVTILMPGFLSAAVGGFIEPAVDGIAAKEGISLKFQLAGQGVYNTIPQVASGVAPFSLSDTADIFIANSKKIPVVEVFSGNDDPTCVMVHPNSGIMGFADLSGHTIEVTPGASYWEWLVLHYKLKNVKQVTYTGTLAEFAANKSISQQCFYTNEPFVATEQHIAHTVFLVKSSGWASYSDTLFTTTSEIKNHPAIVKAVVQAMQAGWAAYYKSPQAVFNYLKAHGDTETPAAKTYVENALKTMFQSTAIGVSTPARMAATASQLKAIKLLPAGFNYKAAYTNAYLKS